VENKREASKSDTSSLSFCNSEGTDGIDAEALSLSIPEMINLTYVVSSGSSWVTTSVSSASEFETTRSLCDVAVTRRERNIYRIVSIMQMDGLY